METAGQGYRHRRRRAKKLRRRAAALGILGAVFLAGAAPAGAGAKATVAPNTSLKDADTVTVAWTGLTAGARLNIFECAQPPTTRTCAVDAGVMNLVNPPTGDGQATLTVHTGPIGVSGAQCSGLANDCVIVINVNGSEDPSANFVLPISFTGAPGESPEQRSQLAQTGRACALRWGCHARGHGAGQARGGTPERARDPDTAAACLVPRRRRHPLSAPPLQAQASATALTELCGAAGDPTSSCPGGLARRPVRARRDLGVGTGVCGGGAGGVRRPRGVEGRYDEISDDRPGRAGVHPKAAPVLFRAVTLAGGAVPAAGCRGLPALRVGIALAAGATAAASGICVSARASRSSLRPIRPR